MFRHKTVKKVYLALCHGLPSWKEKVVENYLSEIDKNSGMVREVFAGGRIAKTRFQTVASFPEQDVSLIACYPETGRSHQIRVHLTSLNLPILGDKKYGDRQNRKAPTDTIKALASEHHFLHARHLEFALDPNPEKLSYTATLPGNFSKSLQLLGFPLEQLP